MSLKPRRDPVERLLHEYASLPGLRLTSGQIKRLCNLPATECEAIVAELVRGGRLQRAPDGCFVSSSSPRFRKVS